MVTMMRKMRRKESLAEMMFRFATRRLIICHCHMFSKEKTRCKHFCHGNLTVSQVHLVFPAGVVDSGKRLFETGTLMIKKIIIHIFINRLPS